MPDPFPSKPAPAEPRNAEPGHAEPVHAKPVHSMIRVLDEARAVGFYRQAFGLDVADRFDFGDFVLTYLRGADSGFEVELTINHSRTEPYALGDGYGHLAVAVVDAGHARTAAAGLAPARSCSV